MSGKPSKIYILYKLLKKRRINIKFFGDESQETEESHWMSVISAKRFIQKIEVRLEKFEQATGTIYEAKKLAEKAELKQAIELLNKEIIGLFLKESQHWLRKENIDKAMKAHLSAATAYLTFREKIDPADEENIKDQIFGKGIPKLWNIGTYYHRQGNVILLSGGSPNEASMNWENAAKCYKQVKRLAQMGSTIMAGISETYSEQAKEQMEELEKASSRLRGNEK